MYKDIVYCYSIHISENQRYYMNIQRYYMNIQSKILYEYSIHISGENRCKTRLRIHTAHCHDQIFCCS